MTRFRVELETTWCEDACAIRALRWLLKRCGRDYGLRCTAIEEIDESDPPDTPKNTPFLP